MGFHSSISMRSLKNLERAMADPGGAGGGGRGGEGMDPHLLQKKQLGAHPI